MKWKTPETAPKDGTVILGDFGYPWPFVTIWNDIDMHWVTVSLQAQEMPSEMIDYWFENEQATMDELKYWMPLPKLCLN
jgi:hypothetical protein